ncbi:hypothetical protein TRFO_34714 [Tritrichomonas foetus]|uniref:AIR9-like A9 domain-containing protein n=1 Tax=Tritrichomonas foetus TaxID=1144522 RepID=A0A1J4JIH6_9EUKA|nr:hypothetical protein TRFO_34714 [Tritrichomonas foetus]|eukprot:OHS98946.1 hypothetical protein TRFO_34714 [Tritrichomonas foetus]
MMRSPRSPRIPIKYRRDRSMSPCVSHKDHNLKKFASNQMGQLPQTPGDLETVKNSHVLLLDLSGNRLTPKSLRNIGPNVRSLNLSQNPLNNNILPYLDKLRSLFLDDCNLISLARIPSFPNLRKLSLVNNRITDFKGIPYFPRLEYLDLRGNPLQAPVHLIIAAFGSIFLKKINQKKIETDDFRRSFELSPLVGYSLRKGRKPIAYENSREELLQSQQFLTKDVQQYIKENELNLKPKLTVTEVDEGHVIHCPYAALSIKWFKHTAPENGSEWSEIQIKNNPSILPITMSIRLHLIRCEFRIGKTKYSIYTDYPLGRGKHEYSLPFPFHPGIEGIPIEGSLMNCLGLPIPAKVAWVKEGATIAKDTKQIILTNKEINKSVACVMQPYCKQDNLIAFSTVFAATDVVKPLYPIVSGITFPETVMEEETIIFTRVMLPDREGASEIHIEKSFSPSGNWAIIETLEPGHLKYKPKGTDVGYFLRISYTPVTDDGYRGETCYFYSQAKVLSSAPKFSNPFIAGVPKTCYPLVAIADYSGGIPGNCTCDWFFSKRPINTKHGPSKRLQKVAHNTQYFTPTEEMADGYLAVLMIPVRKDDVYGEQCFYAMDTPIILDDAPRPFEVPKEAIVGKRMRFPCVCDILLSKPTGFCGFDFLKSSDTYTPREKHAGRILRVVNETGDIIVGPIKIANPVILTVRITADKWQVSHVANIEVTHKSCKPEQLEILWLRIGPNYEKAVALNTPEYVIQPEDASFQLQAVVTPLDNENHKKEPFYSDLSPVIKVDNYSEPIIVGDMSENGTITIDAYKEIDNVVWYHYMSKSQLYQIGEGLSLQLESKDVGKFIRAKVTLKNGIVVYTSSKTTVAPCMPKVEVVLPKVIHEGDIIRPQILYQGGMEGKSDQRWYRETDEGWEFVSDELNFKVTAVDVDCILRFVYIPYRNDKERGEEVMIECGPVDPLPPTARNVRIQQNSKGYLEVLCDYVGGFEGKSFIIWRVYDHKNHPKNVGKTCEREIPPNANFVGKTVDAIYVPIRFDGAGGQPVITSNQIVVEPLPTVQSAEILVKKGRVIEGNKMRCNAQLSKGATAFYQWHHGDGKAWEAIKGATEVEYIPNHDDVGFYMLCSIVAVNEKGWKSLSFAATTISPVGPPDPVLKIISTSDKILAGMILTVNVELTQKKRLLWQRETEDDWINISFEEEYVVTCNDIGCRLRALTSDGLESEPTNPIELEKTLSLYIKAMLRTASFKFIGNPKVGPVIWTVTATPYCLMMETSAGNKKKSKWNLVQAEAVDGTVDEMVLFMDKSSKFVMIPTFFNIDPRLNSIIKPTQVRDYVVSVLLGIKKSHQK